MSKIFFDKSKYDFINEKELSLYELERELNSLRMIKKRFKRTIDEIDTQLIRFREETLKRKEENRNHKLYGE